MQANPHYPVVAVSKAYGFTVLIAALLLAACASSPNGDDLAARIDHVADNALADGPVAGLSIAVMRRGRVIHARGYGVTNLEAQSPATADTVYNIASVGKILTAAAVLKLVDEGRLSLDDSLAERLPGYPDRAQAERITLRQLLNHTSGLHDYVAADIERWQRTGEPLTPDFVLDFVDGRALDFSPGTNWIYSNTGFYLVGLIVERASGRTWAEYVLDEVARPLGLDGFMLCDSATAIRATGYDITPSGPILSREDGETGVRGDAGLCASAVDLASLPTALKNGGLLSDSALDTMLEPTALANGLSIDYGLGVSRGTLHGHRLWGHLGGNTSSYVSTLAHYPDDDVTVAVLVNTRFGEIGALQIEAEVARIALGLPAPRLESRPLAAQARDAYTGNYVGDRGNWRFRIVPDGTGIARVPSERPTKPIRLHHQGNHVFGRRDWPLDRFVFHVANGRAIAYSVYYNGFFDGYYRRDEEAVSAAARALDRLPMLETCQLPGVEEPMLCGELAVPLDRSNPSAGTLDISIVVIPALESPSDAAWTEHQGGPGFSIMNSVKLYERNGPMEQFRRNRDMIFFDQRGVGKSGGLTCEALHHTPVLRERFPPGRVRACREELVSRGIDLGHYSTNASVDDLDAIRDWLGYETLDLGGWSYGSRFMLTYMHRYPDRVRTATLVVPLTVDFRRPLHYARFVDQAFEKLADACISEPACGSVFPDPMDDLRQLAERLESEPVTTEFLHPETNALTTAQVDRTVLAGILWHMLLDTGKARHLPRLLNRAAEGDLQPLLDAKIPDQPGELFHEAMYLSLVCPEEVVHIRPGEIDAAVAGTVIGRIFVDSWIEACNIWNLPTVPGTPTPPRELAIPTLVITGDLDPVSQPEYGRRIVANLPNGLHVNVEGEGHSGGMSTTGCMNDVILDFLAAGSVDGLDTSCLAAIEPPPFQTEPAE